MTFLFTVGAIAQAPARKTFDNGITLDFERLPPLTIAPPENAQVVGEWLGRFSAARCYVTLSVMRRSVLGIDEPDGLVGRVLSVWKGYHVDARELVPGPYGFAPYAALAELRHESEGREGYILCGLLRDACFYVAVDCYGKLDDGERDRIRTFLREGVRYSGPVRDPRWSDAEARDRWAAGPGLVTTTPMKPPIRTPHYIVLTNGDHGRTFADVIEANHARIREVFPFPEVAERRLLPVFLFASPDEHAAFYKRQKGVPDAPASVIAGHALFDYYATSDEDPDSGTHIHEATHQLLENRLFLARGASWLHEGCAEFMCTPRASRDEWSRDAIGRGTALSLERFAGLGCLAQGDGPDHCPCALYRQASAIIGFLHDDPRYAPRFDRLIRALGTSPADTDAQSAVMKAVIGLDLAGLEREWRRAFSVER